MSKILERYLDFVERTEPRDTFHRWAFLSGCSAVLGRNVWFPFGHDRIYPNQYIVLVGSPGTRKSTAIKIIKNLVHSSGYSNFSFSKTSKQKFLMDFAQGFNVDLASGVLTGADLLDLPLGEANGASEAFVCNDELVDFLGIGNFDMVSLLANLWDNLPKYDERLKNSDSVIIQNPTVNILGGITPVSLQLALPKEAMGQGFMSRLVLVFADSIKRKITFPKPPDPAEQEFFIGFFKDLRKVKGEMVLSPKAEEHLERMYQQWRNTFDVRLESYAARRFTHLIKISIVLAAIDKQLIITPEHTIEANTILLYTEQDMASALGDYGEARNSEAIQKIMAALTAAPDYTMHCMDLWKQVYLDLNDIRDLHQIINNLRQANRIHIHDDSQVTLVRHIPLDVEGIADFKHYIREYTGDGKLAAYISVDGSSKSR